MGSTTTVSEAERRLFVTIGVLVFLVVWINSGGLTTTTTPTSVVQVRDNDGNKEDVPSHTSPPLSDVLPPPRSGAQLSPAPPSSSSQAALPPVPILTIATSSSPQEKMIISYFRPLPVETRGKPLPPGLSTINPDDSTPLLPPLTSDEELKNLRFAVMAKNIPPGLGLTTQLLTYIHLIAAAQLLRRALVFPVARRTTWFTLINMSATSFPGDAPFSYVASRDTAAKAVGRSRAVKTNFKWTREFTYGIPHIMRRSLVGFGHKTAGVPVVRLPSMFKLYPFGAPEEKLNFGRYLCGVVFNSKIEGAAATLLEEMKRQQQQSSTDIRYVSVHLRIEPQDSVAFRRGAPSPKQLRDWFSRAVGKVCLKYGTNNVFVASGPLGKEYEQVVEDKEGIPIHGTAPGARQVMRIFTKKTLLESLGNRNNVLADSFFNEERTTVSWSGKSIYPTNTRTAAVDVLLLERGVASVVTSFSSLTPFVYARQCFAGPRCFGRSGEKATTATTTTSTGANGGGSSDTAASRVAPGVYIYEVGDDGEMSNAKLYKCGYRMQELLRGGGLADPPKLEDLFAENVRKDRMKLFQ